MIYEVNSSVEDYTTERKRYTDEAVQCEIDSVIQSQLTVSSPEENILEGPPSLVIQTIQEQRTLTREANQF